MKFKIGDKVTRIMDAEEKIFNPDFNKGTVYTVNSISLDDEYALGLKELPGYAGYDPNRFQLVEPRTSTTNPKDLVGAKKVDLSLIPPASQIYQAAAMENGAAKYGPFNWREKKIQTRSYITAVQRHLAQYLDGEENADDSGLPHLAHAIAGLGILIDAIETGNVIDNRPAKGAASKVLDKFKKDTATTTVAATKE